MGEHKRKLKEGEVRRGNSINGEKGRIETKLFGCGRCKRFGTTLKKERGRGVYICEDKGSCKETSIKKILDRKILIEGKGLPVK